MVRGDVPGHGSLEEQLIRFHSPGNAHSHGHDEFILCLGEAYRSILR